MSILKRSLSIFFVFGLLITQPFLEAWAGFEIIVFDCAQGNTVTAKYKKKVMIFDAGRTGSSQFVAHEDDKGHESEIDIQYLIENKTENLIKLEVPSKRYGLASVTQNNRIYREAFIKKLNKYISGKDDGNILQAIFISHPDIDHYNIVPQLETKPNVFVLGGNFNLYSKKFHEYVKDEVLIKDEKYGEKASIDRYVNRKSFLKHCNFGKEENDPKVKILSVNAEKSGEKNKRNDDSMIVKLSQKYSMIIPGDAEGDTWKDAENNVKDLSADVLLLSHHGAKTNDSTSLILLNKIKPKVCLISAGMTANYGHPTEEVINILLDYYNNQGKNFRTTPHFITCHQGKTRKSFVTNAPIFTTIDNGELTLDLGSENLSINVSRDFYPTPNVSIIDKSYLLSFERASNRNIIDLKALKGFKQQGLLEKTSRFEDVYRVKKKQGSNAEDYYYKVGQAFFKVELAETGVNSDEDSFEKDVLNMEEWIEQHPKAKKLILEPIITEWQSDEEND